MKKILLALAAVAALSGCTAHDTPTTTVIGEGTKGYLVQYTGVRDLPDSWPCGDNGVDTCAWLPKIKEG